MSNYNHLGTVIVCMDQYWWISFS